jgi:Abnormal spindle-like microcephaly-assoc'd, ASPM-SPD-2-Hydin
LQNPQNPFKTGSIRVPRPSPVVLPAPWFLQQRLNQLPLLISHQLLMKHALEKHSRAQVFFTSRWIFLQGAWKKLPATFLVIKHYTVLCIGTQHALTNRDPGSFIPQHEQTLTRLHALVRRWLRTGSSPLNLRFAPTSGKKPDQGVPMQCFCWVYKCAVSRSCVLLFLGVITCVTASFAASSSSVPELQLSTRGLNFGSVSLNVASAPQSVTLTSSGTAPLTISSATLEGSEFRMSGLTLPVTLNPGQTATLTVVFAPTATGRSTGSIRIVDNASQSTKRITLSGEGLAAQGILSGLSCSQASITGSGTDACTVTLTAAAATGGQPVSLSSNETAVTVPSSVTVAAGATTASFTATVSAVSTAETATLTASSGGGTQAYTISLGVAGQPALSGLNCSSGSFTGSGTDTCTVTLNAAAATGGQPVSLSSSVAAVTVPSSVTVAAGATTASFTATVSAVSTAETATLTASSGGVAHTYTISLSGTAQPALSGLSCSSGLFTGAGTDVCTVTLNAAAGSGGQSVSLSSNETAVTVPSSVTVAAGATTASFTATVSAVSTAETATLTASSGGGTEAYTISLSGAGQPPALSGLSCSSGSITGSGTDACTVTLTAAAATGGQPVSLSSNVTAVTVPSSVTVAAGATTASFTATVSAVSTAETATLTASSGGVTHTYTISLGPGVPTLTLESTNVPFGNVTLSNPAYQSVILTSSGTAAVTVSAGSVSGTGYTISGVSFPLTLNPGQTATLEIEFDPTTAGVVDGTVTLISNSSTGTTATISLSGTGVAASYQVNLTWDAPTNPSDPVASYNIYRAVSGSSTYQVLNSSTSTSYTDMSVANGTSYSYYVESVDASGNQSGPSNVFSATIP